MAVCILVEVEKMPIMPAKRRSSIFGLSGLRIRIRNLGIRGCDGSRAATSDVARYHSLRYQTSIIANATEFGSLTKSNFQVCLSWREHLAAPSGSVATGRLLSEADSVIYTERASLKSSKADDIMFFYSNSHKFLSLNAAMAL